MSSETKKVYHYLYNIKMFGDCYTLTIDQVGEVINPLVTEEVIENMIEKVEDELYDILKNYLEKFDVTLVNKQTLYLHLLCNMEVIVENHLINGLICRFTVQKDSSEYIEIHISIDGCITKVEEKIW